MQTDGQGYLGPLAYSALTERAFLRGEPGTKTECIANKWPPAPSARIDKTQLQALMRSRHVFGMLDSTLGRRYPGVATAAFHSQHAVLLPSNQTILSHKQLNQTRVSSITLRR